MEMCKIRAKRSRHKWVKHGSIRSELGQCLYPSFYETGCSHPAGAFIVEMYVSVLSSRLTLHKVVSNESVARKSTTYVMCNGAHLDGASGRVVLSCEIISTCDLCEPKTQVVIVCSF